MRSPLAALALLVPALLWPIVAAGEPPLRDQARTVLLEHCGTCHDGTLQTAKPKALAIFDLSQAAWSSGLDDQRLGKLISRMVSFGTGDAARATIAAFVAVERAERVKRRGP